MNKILKTIKNILKRGLLGGIIEIAISYIITVIISSFVNDGYFHPVVPELINVCGTEQNAIIFQTILSFGIGFIIGIATLVWENNSWNLFLKTVIHFLLIIIAVTPAAWFCRWFPHSVKGMLFFISYFVFVYTIIWVAMTVPQIIAIKKINQKIRK